MIQNYFDTISLKQSFVYFENKNLIPTKGQNLSCKAKTFLHANLNKYIGDFTFSLNSKKMPIMQLDLQDSGRNKIFFND